MSLGAESILCRFGEVLKPSVQPVENSNMECDLCQVFLGGLSMQGWRAPKLQICGKSVRLERWTTMPAKHTF